MEVKSGSGGRAKSDPAKAQNERDLLIFYSISPSRFKIWKVEPKSERI
jgi:hypothetical protein